MVKHVTTYKTVIVDDKPYRVNCAKFSARSSFFDVLFYGGFAETYEDTVFIYGIEEFVFDEIFILLNTGEISFRCNIAVPVYMACRYFGIIDELMADVMEYMRCNFDDMTMLSLLMFTWTHNDPLYTEARDYVAKYIEYFYELPSFTDFPAELLVDILNSADICVTAERDFTRILATWFARDSDRKTDIESVLLSLTSNRITSLPEISKWTKSNISSAIESAILVPVTVKPYKSWISTHNDPLYVSKRNEKICVFHYSDGIWSELDRPMITVACSEKTKTQAARRQAHVFITTPNGNGDRCTFIHCNIGTNRVQLLRETGNSAYEGLFWVNDELYTCDGQVVQKYCSQYNLWLKPLEIDMIDPAFFASDGRFLYTLAKADENESGKCIYLYDYRCRNWNRISSTSSHRNFLCGGFANGNFYAADERFIDYLDVRAMKWQYYMPLPQISRKPRNLTQYRDNIIVLDIYNNTFICNIREKRWSNLFGSNYHYMLNVVHCVDWM